jgi:hypothetical protein
MLQKTRHLGNDEIHIVWSEHYRDYRNSCHLLYEILFSSLRQCCGSGMIFPDLDHTFRLDPDPDPASDPT